MGRSPCCSKNDGLNRGAWTAMEDKILTEYVKTHGEGKWRNLPKKAGLQRCGKSCRLRWLNYLRPDIKRGNITLDEEELIIRLHKLLGNRWSLIAGRLPGRTDNEIKNYWNTNIRKKLQNQQTQALDKPNSRIQPAIALEPSPPINAPLENNPDHKKPTVPPPVVPATANISCNNESLPESSTQFTAEENNSSDLMMDFEMDEQLLSDLLNSAEFSQLSNFDDKGRLSAEASQDSLFSDYILHDESDFPVVGSVMESEFDWLRD